MYESKINRKRITRLPQSFGTLRLPLASALTAVMLSGCSVLDDGFRNLNLPSLPNLFHNNPKTAQAVVDQPTAADKGAIKNAPPEGSDKPDQLAAPSSLWWRNFHNPELDQIIASAMDNNHDLKVAIARIAQAEEAANVANASLYPTLNTTGKYTGSQGATSTQSPSYYRIPSFGFQAAYELDLWGKNGYAAESALALAQASVHYREGVALTLASDITKAYIDFLSESDHISVAENNLYNSRNSLQAVQTRMDQGDATLVELLQQQTTVANAEGVLEVHRLNREKSFNKLAALMGTTPSELSLVGGTLSTLVPPDLSPGIPAQLMCRRPDIRRAEATMIGAELDVKVARAKLFPDITFSLDIGRSAYSFASMILPSNHYSTIVGQIAQPLYDAGKNTATVRQNNARYMEMVQSYHQTIINAVHDVEDALASLRLTGEQRKALVRATGYAKQAYDLSAYSFDKHAIDFLSLLESQRTLYTTQDAEVSARTDLFKASVDLFTALGGGLEEPHC